MQHIARSKEAKVNSLLHNRCIHYSNDYQTIDVAFKVISLAHNYNINIRNRNIPVTYLGGRGRSGQGGTILGAAF